MKTLELNQMEVLQGGSCTSDTVGSTLALVGVISAAAGPIGWGVFAVFALSVSVASLISNGDCF